ncbi:MAG: GIY-YIG nuclease family protein [Planctomycetota bacterium]
MLYGWLVYILECKDHSYYTGITNDLEQRLSDHNSGKGAKYTRHRRPVILIYTETYPDKITANKREIEIKRMSRARKGKLVDSGK